MAGQYGRWPPVASSGAGIVWRGPWSSLTTYSLNDAVVLIANGSSYISIANANLNNPPDSSPGQWDLLAAASGISALTGDVTAAGSGSVPATVEFVDGSSAADVHSAELLANAATDMNTASTIVKRDANGKFSASVLTLEINSSSGSLGLPPSGYVLFFMNNETGQPLVTTIDSDGNEKSIGGSLTIAVSNNTGVAWPAGAAIAVLNSGSGLAKANALSTMPCVGLTTTAIADGDTGFAILDGILVNVDTSAFSFGDKLYLSPTVAGGLTNVAPVHPNLEQLIGIVGSVDSIFGSILVQSTGIMGADYGTVRNSFTVGSGGGGAKSLIFKNTNTGTLAWNPGANITLNLPAAAPTASSVLLASNSSDLLWAPATSAATANTLVRRNASGDITVNVLTSDSLLVGPGDFEIDPPPVGYISIISKTFGPGSPSFLQTKDPNGNQTRIGIDIQLPSFNNTGGTLAAGSVIYNTNIGGNESIQLAKADSASTSPAIGFLTAAVLDGGIALFLRNGIIDYDTSGFSSGDNLYLSASVAGGITNVKPSHPNLVQYVGYAIDSDPAGTVIFEIGALQGNDDGTAQNSFAIGNSASGVKSLLFTNANTGTLSWNPTGSRTLTLPDVTDTLVGLAAVQALSNKTITDQLVLTTVGKGLTLKEGSNAKMGISTMVGGTVTVSTTAVTASSRIFVTANSTSTAHGSLWVDTISAGTSFKINSTNILDDAAVAWFIVEAS